MNICFDFFIKIFNKGKQNCVFKIMFLSLVFFCLLTFAILMNISFINNLDIFLVTKTHNFAIAHQEDLFLTNLIIFITNLGASNFILPVSFILIFILMKLKHFKEALFIFSVNVSAGLSVIILKSLICRLRPDVVSPFIKAYWYGYPSGHATLSTAFYGTLIYLIFVYTKNPVLKVLLINVLITLISLIGFSRVYLGVHFPMDVLAGFSLGVFWSAFCLWVYNKSFK